MPASLALSLPATAAGLAYLNARTRFSYDRQILGAALASAMGMFYKKWKGKLNMFYLLEDRAKDSRSAHRPLLLFGDSSYTYAQVYERVLRYGAWWKEKMGVKQHEVVALDLMNSDNFIFLWLGLWAVGATPAFINYNLREKALVHCIKLANARLVIVDRDLPDALPDAMRAELEGVNIDIFTPEREAEALAMAPTRYPDELRAADKVEGLANLIYTSGTTGLPKAAVVSWGKFVFPSVFISRMAGTKSTDILYTCMPLYHSVASVIGFAHILGAGATIALGVKFSTKTFWAEVRKHNATMIQYVGETCRYLLTAPPDLDPVTHENLDKKNSVRMALGNGLGPDVWSRFKERFGIETIFEYYAATESPFGTWNVSKNDFSAGAIGRSGWLLDIPLRFIIALVQVDHATEQPRRDPKTGFMRRVKSGQPGELLVALPPGNVESQFQGYYDNKEATNAKIMRNVFKQGDAWFRTGDMMRWDAEGRLYFHDRIGDTFRWKSENVSTTEVAQVIGRHPAVHEANVYGVRLPHHDGRAGCMALALAERPSRKVRTGLAQHIETGLPRYARPLFLRVVRGVGVHATGTNKQQKHGLREQGVAPEKMEGDELFWLKNGTYEPFGTKEWHNLNAGKVKL